MRSIQLKNYSYNQKNKQYEILLFWNTTISIKNEVEIKKILVSLSKKYNKFLHNINELYIQAHSHVLRYIFDVTPQHSNKLIKFISNINERTNFILNQGFSNNVMYTATLLYISYQILDFVQFALIHLKKIKFSGVEVALNLIAKNLNDLIFEFKIQNQIELSNYSQFITEYQSKYIIAA